MGGGRLPIFAVVACACLAGAPVAGAAPSDRDAVNRAMRLVAAMEEPAAPGCAFGVYRDGAPLFESAYGLSNLSSKAALARTSTFGVASVTKQFTAAAVAIAAQRKHLSLDDDIREHLPEMPDYGSPITVRDLVHHVSGLRDYGHLIKLTRRPGLYQDRQSIFRLIARQSALNFEPRTEFLYSNSNYLLLELLLERATSSTLGDFSHRHLFRPLGMADTHYADAPKHAPHLAIPYSAGERGWQISGLEPDGELGAGGLFTSLRDYARWAAFLLSPDGRVAGGGRLVKTLLEPATLKDGSRSSYAFGIDTTPHRGLETLSHGGSGDGYKTYTMIFPRQRLALAGFCNNGRFVDATVLELADIFLGIAPVDAVRGAGPFQMTAGELERFAGTYREPTLALPRVLTVQGADLRMRGDFRELTLIPTEANRFRERSGVKEFLFRPPSADSGRPGGFQVLGDRLSDRLTAGSGRFERIDVARPGAVDLAAYRGSYHSDDLDADYIVAIEDGELVIRSAASLGESAMEASRLEPMLEDEFASMEEPLIVRFHRNAGGRVEGFAISAQFGWVRDVRFMKEASRNQK